MSTREMANATNTFCYHALGDGLWLEIDPDGDTDTVSDLQMGANCVYDRGELVRGAATYYNAMRYYPAPEKQEQYTPAAAIWLDTIYELVMEQHKK